ncbi:MAG: type I-B CRISPR-associated endonuclease Cas1 [Candidatus Eremiobacteraeota bacterium]|nr:type I-B CRISPR-associated endonuclease Cas1 [Candidatus Eremiobacteraeota bacterium]
MKKSIYIFSDGELKRKENTLYFESEEGKKYIPVENISEIMLFGEVSLNKRLLEFISRMEIIVHFFNHYGYYVGSFYPREHFNSGFMILRQAEHYNDDEKRLVLAMKFVKGAAENIKKVLEYYANRGKPLEDTLDKINHLADRVRDTLSTGELMALEGNIRDYYYGAFDTIIENPIFTFEERTRRPPKNRLNSLISFGNSILYTIVLSEIYKTHLDPRIGFLHSTNFRRFTLNLDVAEIFKPIIVDRVIFTMTNKRILKASHFEKKAKGIVLNEKGRRIFITEMDNRMKSTIKHRGLGRSVSYRRLIRLELYKLEKHLIGEKVYESYVSRW